MLAQQKGAMRIVWAEIPEKKLCLAVNNLPSPPKECVCRDWWIDWNFSAVERREFVGSETNCFLLR